jgi:hypothetical protein
VDRDAPNPPYYGQQKGTDMSDFNALDTTRRLEGRGFSREQAETLAQLLADLWGSIVTRTVLREELAVVRQEIGALRHDMDLGFAAVRRDTDQGLQLLEQRMTVRLDKMMARATGAAFGVAGLFLTASTLIIHFWH